MTADRLAAFVAQNPTIDPETADFYDRELLRRLRLAASITSLASIANRSSAQRRTSSTSCAWSTSTSRTAQRAYQFERGANQTFLDFTYWNSLHKGLLAGECLMQSLAQMEKTESPNVLIDSLRITTGCRVPHTPTPRKKQNS